ncbi:FBD-associated F-box protein At4g13985-like [Chenopodium quinoa]|uniref:FBD-associated F-box protein At4g13985-like n=1 Tax=Chenopodium quinoa TaxID=63459 RepID=UPI000B78DD52|nr:FBD-associated F-box protein At4g13985-like [Chenopodium quinoa]
MGFWVEELREEELGLEFGGAKFKSWIRLISKRNVSAIKAIREPPSRTPLPTLPSTIFEIRSLVHLQLVGLLQCKLPSVVKGIVTLPNLKKLELGDVIWDDLQKLWALISSCPLLEVLSLGLQFYNDGVVNVNITSPVLKSLIIDHPSEVKFAIDTPMLEHLALTGRVGHYSFARYPTKLIKAELNVYVNGPFTDNEFSKILPLIRRISGVKSLSLSIMNFFKALNSLKVDVGSIFCNLTHLRWTWPSVNNNLDVQHTLPVCLFSKIKRLELLKMKANANNLKMLEYILSKAIVLERLHISSGDYAYGIGHSGDVSYFVGKNKDILWWEYQIYNTLLAAPKSSLLSDIEFVGTYIHASRDRSQNGFIVTINSQTTSPTSTIQ